MWNLKFIRPSSTQYRSFEVDGLSLSKSKTARAIRISLVIKLNSILIKTFFIQIFINRSCYDDKDVFNERLLI